ncbi:hypothetical protein [Streptomyces regalis]|uniref:Gram-positive cocci surface proteins LPxTG domain-containing protein n=1 Tax=Streptomyces regalis TaxID=68262 RepID=A0A0X3V885_9ACTN|nr:hypothetical protein [Streptomyces regalis]KUL41023.1 hypothetical protein ADL12_12195 [Streptomyces regalis]
MPTLTPSRSFRARAGATVVLTALAAAGASWVAAPTASAQANGDIRIHGEGMPYGTPDDEAVVCRFYLDAVNFDTLPSIEYTITPQPPLPSAATVTGTIQLAGGAGHTDLLGLADGQYMITWTVDVTNTKRKLFRVKCGDRREGRKGPEGRIEDHQHHDEGWGRGDHGPKGGVHAGGGGLVDTAAAYAPVTAAAAVGLVAVGGTAYVRRTRRRPDGAA